MCPLGDGEHFVDQLVPRRRVRLQVKFRDRVHLLRDFQIIFKLVLADRAAIPRDLALSRHSNGVLERLDWRRRVVLLVDRQVQLHGVRLDRNGDDEHDEQNEHDVDERRHVHIDHRLAFDIVASGLH